MIGARIDVRAWGAEFAKQINDRVAVELAQASETGAKVAAAAVTRRRTGKMGRVDAVPVRATADGWEAGFKSEAWYSGFQSRGTLGSRKRALSAATRRRRESVSGQARLARVGASRGIRPLRHEEKGLAAAKKDLVARINRLT